MSVRAARVSVAPLAGREERAERSAIASEAITAPAAPRHGRRARTALDYRGYPAFTWSWSWRRTVLFGFFAIIVASGIGASNGLLLNDARLGWIYSGYYGGGLTLTVALGPLLGAAVRSGHWSLGRERIGVVVAVLLAVAACYGINQLETRLAYYFVVPRALELHVINAAYLARTRAFTNSLGEQAARPIIYFLLSGGLALRTYFGEQRRLLEEARERALGSLKLQKEQVDLRLLLLQAQIEPHFLFNTLASLRSLLRQDVGRAEVMIDALVEHLRATLPAMRASPGDSTLADQLRLCSSYLDLMTIRLPDRLTYEIAVPAVLEGAPFPALILLTLVENAVKHGIEPKPGPGHIRVEAARADREDGPHLLVRVIDDGMGLKTGLGHGVGLTNVRSQLALKYHSRASFSLTAPTTGGTIAAIDVPDETGAEQ
ncbi:MAG: sensor histidine kinase [Steroidobacteraceae bacterium]